MADDRVLHEGQSPYDYGSDRLRDEELGTPRLHRNVEDSATANAQFGIQQHVSSGARQQAQHRSSRGRELSFSPIADSSASNRSAEAAIDRRSTRARASPYSARNPSRVSASPSLQQQPRSSPSNSVPLSANRSNRLPTSASPHGSTRTTYADDSSPATTTRARYRLLVEPIIKSSVGQRDASGKQKDDFAACGNSMDEIIELLWNNYHTYVKCRAIRADDDSWSVETPDAANWDKVMQLKASGHLVKASNMTEETWHKWLDKLRKKNESATLYIYEYGNKVVKGRDLVGFKEACILPEQTDRAGAAAESELRAIARRLQTHWQDSFRADAVAWRMLANHIIRNLNRSTWDSAISQLPPSNIMNFLRPADSHFEGHLSHLTRSCSVALDCVRGCMADFQQLRQDWEAFGRRLDECERHMQVRESTIEAFLRDIPPPPLDEVIDPLQDMENLEDTEHMG